MCVAASVKDTALLLGAGVAVTLAAVLDVRRWRVLKRVLDVRRWRVLARVRWAIGW